MPPWPLNDPFAVGGIAILAAGALSWAIDRWRKKT